VVLEKLPLVLQRIRNSLLVLNIPLSSVDHGHVAQPQRTDAPSENVHNVGTVVHEIDLGQDANRPLTLGIHLARQLETVRIGQIRVGGRDGEYYGVGLADLLEHHLADLALDIPRLVAHGHLCETGQIDQGQRQDLGRVYPQVDGRRRDARVAPRLGLCLAHNLVPDLAKVVELLARDVQKLAPLVHIVLIVGRLGRLLLDPVGLRGVCGLAVDELENERSSRHDAGSSRQAVVHVSMTAQALEAVRRRSTHKSRPTMFSSTELFPLDCDPTTAIWGRSMGFWTWLRHQYGASCRGGGAGGDVLLLW
jgi:hypothetical protein